MSGALERPPPAISIRNHGEGRLFAGYLSVKPRCDHCGPDFTFANSGDGPAVFVMLIAGFIVTGAALLVQVAYRPPFGCTL